MIPLAPHTEREREGDRERRRERERKRESDMETKKRPERPKHCEKIHTEHYTWKTMSARAAKRQERRKQARTKGTRDKREFKASLERLVHLHNGNNYKCPPQSLLQLSPPPHPFISLCDSKRERRRWFKCISSVCFPYGRPAACVRAGTFCLEPTQSAEKTL